MINFFNYHSRRCFHSNVFISFQSLLWRPSEVSFKESVVVLSMHTNCTCKHNLNVVILTCSNKVRQTKTKLTHF